MEVNPEDVDSCGICGALVFVADKIKHADWHHDRAVANNLIQQRLSDVDPRLMNPSGRY
jgi:hypothetical protein